MTTSYFDQAFSFVLKSEGGFVNDAKDPGGATKWGVANFREKLSAYEMYVGRQVSDVEIENLTLDEVKKFYFQVFYCSVKCDQIKWPAITIALFDSSVLYGQQTTSLMAQRALNECGMMLLADGVIGKLTVKCLNEVDTRDFIDRFVDQIFKRIQRIVAQDPVKKKYENGWKNRTSRLLTLAKLEPSNRKLIK
jgi:lysozyme family protein